MDPSQEVPKSSEIISNEQRNSLYRAAQKGDWKTVKKFIDEHPDARTAKINEDGTTILHLAVRKNETMWLVDDILNSIHHPSLLEEVDNTGNTALSYAVIEGNIKAATELVKKNEDLLLKTDIRDYTPLHHAAWVGHKEIVEFLLSKTKDHMATLLIGDSGATLFHLLITSKLYGIALAILKQHMELFVENRVLTETFKKVVKEVLRTLSPKPQEFASGIRDLYYGWAGWQLLIYKWIPVTEEKDYPLFSISIGSSTDNSTKFTIFGVFQRISNIFGKVYLSFWNIMKRTVPWINDVHNKKLSHMQALELVKLICKGMINCTLQEAFLVFKEPLFLATKFGIVEFVNEIIEAYPQSASFFNYDGQNIFQFAVLHRQEHVLNLIYKMDTRIHFHASDTDYSGNNILHLAGKLQPSSRISGAALQMQRELQWFKAIENFVIDVRPSLLEDRNQGELQLTPREVFTKEHKELVKEGQEWMKNAAQSYTVVAALIITITFAAAFTVPGGNKTEGVPIYLHDSAFTTFLISDAIALISSCTSVLMCLGILTSRYSEEDFLVSLPRKLILGLITLYFSLGCMMVAFFAALEIVLTHTKTNVSLPIVTLVVSVVFGFSQFPLLLKIIRSTYVSSFLQPNKLIRRSSANFKK